ncbi:MAG: HEAT repeat domain-containing protein [Balneolales bacterium]
MDICLYILIPVALITGACSSNEEPWPPGLQTVPDKSPILTPEEALQSFYLPPGYDIELVVSEPMVEDPIAIDFDADGRMWVAEMRGYMPDANAEGEKEPVGKIVVLEDTSGDGRMDKRTVYMDNLILPRSLKVLDQGVLVAAPPYLWMTKDTTGNLQADIVEVVRDDYGDPDTNPEHNSNGLMWGMDNWIHNTGYSGRFRMDSGRLQYEASPSLGQWGITMDDYGRVYRNSNSNPLAVDYIPPHYTIRNKNLNRRRGVYQAIYESRAVWPIRPNTGINRGYQKNQLREDNTLANYTAASALAVYRGHSLPEELRGNVFVPEPAANLVQRYVLKENEDGSLTGRNAYEDLKADFLTSTDERFRPVNIYTAPDGSLYIIDMYRGILQHRYYLTDYLKNEINQRGLEAPIGLGRIYRIVHKSGQSYDQPNLSEKTPNELVEILKHPNGWWRDTAQRILVERKEITIAPELRSLAVQGQDDYMRLHALWTLEGLNETDPDIIKQALSDPSPHLRAAAIRIAESLLSRSEIRSAVLGLLDDDHPVVRRQLAATVGEFPSSGREDALLEVVERHSHDPIVVSLVVSALSGQEFDFLNRFLDKTYHSQTITGESDVVETLAVTLLRSENNVQIRTMLNWIGDEARPKWQQMALLGGLEDVVPRPSPTRVRWLELDHKPEILLAVAESGENEVSQKAKKVADRLGWPGKPRPEMPSVVPLTAEQQERFDRGSDLFGSTCGACHGPDGRGTDGMAPSLVDSDWVLGRRDRLLRILLHGFDGDMLMPPANYLSDDELAAITTYIRRSWGHDADPISPANVFEIRGVTTGRAEPWTADELNAIR